jgi:hypothetical protein
MRKRIVWAAVVLLVAALGVGAQQFRKLAIIGSGYAAEQTCACLFVSGRSLDSCRHDLDVAAQRMVKLEPGEQQVHARTPLASATARYQPGFGCTLVE